MSSQPYPNSSATTPDNAAWRRESERLEAAYAKRDAANTDQHAWTVLRPEAHWLDFSIQRFLYASLVHQGWTARTIQDCKILEVGCGTARVLRWLYGAGARSLWGCDALAKPIEEAQKNAPFAQIRQANMAQLPFEDARFDCVAQVTAFSSCLDGNMRRMAADEMLRVLAPEGCLLWCDFKPMRGEASYAHGINAAEIRTLFPGCDIRMKHFGAHPSWLGHAVSVVNQGPLQLITGSRKPVTKFPTVIAGCMEWFPGLTTYLGAIITKKKRNTA